MQLITASWTVTKNCKFNQIKQNNRTKSANVIIVYDNKEASKNIDRIKETGLKDVTLAETELKYVTRSESSAAERDWAIENKLWETDKC